VASRQHLRYMHTATSLDARTTVPMVGFTTQGVVRSTTLSPCWTSRRPMRITSAQVPRSAVYGCPGGHFVLVWHWVRLGFVCYRRQDETALERAGLRPTCISLCTTPLASQPSCRTGRCSHPDLLNQMWHIGVFPHSYVPLARTLLCRRGTRGPTFLDNWGRGFIPLPLQGSDSFLQQCSGSASS
jgi:hypothetical protein